MLERNGLTNVKVISDKRGHHWQKGMKCTTNRSTLTQRLVGGG